MYLEIINKHLYFSDQYDVHDSLCEYQEIAGDGICDDESNIYACGFDRGDCCGNDVIIDKCLQCMCFSKYITLL